MSGVLVLAGGAGCFLLVVTVVALLIWGLARGDASSEKARVLREMLQARYDLDLLAHEARSRIASVKGRRRG